MKIAVLGATGGVGRQVVRQALEQGLQVVALARQPATVKEQLEQGATSNNALTLAAIDMRSQPTDGGGPLGEAIRGCDMVLSCLGNKRGEEKIVAEGTGKLLSAMQANGVPRMAFVSSIGVGDSAWQLLRLGVSGWVFSAIFATVLKGTKEDLQAAEDMCIGPGAAAMRPEGVSVVAVRPAGLTNEPGSQDGHGVALSSGTVAASISRVDVARFMLTLLKDTQYDNGAVSIGGKPRWWQGWW